MNYIGWASACEQSEGPDREIDAVIAVAFSNNPGASVVREDPTCIFSYIPGWWNDGEGKSHSAPAYTASMDAAKTLLPENEQWRVGRDEDDPSVYVAQCSYTPNPGGFGGVGFVVGIGATPALALTSAALRVRAAKA